MRRQQAQCVPPLARAVFCVAADQPHEHGYERERQQHDQRRFEIDDRHPGDHQEGDDRRQHRLREISREISLERLDALHRNRSQFGTLGAVERRGLCA